MCRLAWVLVVALTGCLDWTAVTCEDGLVCPTGSTCDEVHHSCLSAAQTGACAGLGDGSACTYLTVPGTCQAGVCIPRLCGDGQRTAGEDCDGSDLGGATCLDAGFYAPTGLACTPFCTFDTSACSGGFCGDGLVNGSELCDGAPPAQTCIDSGYNAGLVSCRSCGADLDACARFDWRSEVTGLDNALDIAGHARTDLWVAGTVGSGAALAHFDGATWNLVPIAGDYLLNIDEDSSGAVWAISLASTPDTWLLYHGSGDQLTTVAGVPSDQYNGVRAFGSDDVYLASAGHGLLHGPAAGWESLGGRMTAMTSVVGPSGSDLWVTEGSGAVVHWDGSTWRDTAFPGSALQIAPLSPTDAWAIGFTGDFTAVVARWDGTRWTVVDGALRSLARPAAVFASADNDVWVADNTGALSHFDGIAWAASGISITPDRSPVAKVLSVGRDLVAVSFPGRVFRYSGQMYGQDEVPTTGRASALWTDRADDVYVGDTTGSIYHFDGVAWQLAFSAPSPIVAIGGSGPDNVWGGTLDGVVHFDGSAWTSISVQLPVGSVWSSSANDVWLGEGGQLSHFDGVAFTLLPLPPSQLADGISGTGPQDVWFLVGDTAPGALGTVLYHWDGAALGSAQLPPRQLVKLAAAAPDDLFAIGDFDHVLRYAAGAWTEVILDAADPLVAIDASAPDDVFAATSSQLFHFDGISWSPVTTDPNLELSGASTIRTLQVRPDVVTLLYASVELTPASVERLIRTRRWDCRATETACSDGVDDDCDGLVDGNDPDCAH